MNINLADPVIFDCPFCKGTFAVGDPDKGDAAVVHTLPACQKFLDLEITDFIREARLKMDN